MGEGILVTYSGEEISLLNIEEVKINIEDIAHALSYICRFAGQCKQFYSVGSHSINCLRVAEHFGYSDELKLYTLLHDATEAYICDMPSPLKKILPEYKKYENDLESIIHKRFGLNQLTEFDKAKIKEIDKIVFSQEWKELMNYNYEDQYTNILIPNLDFSYQNMETVEKQFLIEAKKLIK